MACEWQISQACEKKMERERGGGIRWNGSAETGKIDLLFQSGRLQQKYLLSKFISLQFNAPGLSLCFPISLSLCLCHFLGALSQ